MAHDSTLSLDPLLAALRAGAEETRLRILLLLAEGELTVSDITDVLGQSQPRISRHLKLMAEAGLLERHREGSWVFFRLAGRGVATDVWRAILSALDPADRVVAADRERLAAVRAARAAAAQAFFTRLAPEWDRLSTLHAPEAEVDAAILGLIGRKDFDAVLDLGTGTGRMLKLFAPSAGRAVGVDASHAMLAVARANLEAAGLRHVELRQGDIYAPPVERGAFDLVVIHQVLHYLDDPGRAIREAAAALAPSGLLLVVDFAPHDVESLRETHGHRRLGLAPDQVAGAMTAAGLDCVAQRDLPPPRADAGQLTVSVFLGRDRRIVTDAPFPPASLEVA